MKSLSGIPSFGSSFQRHRSNCNTQKFALELSLSKTTPAPIWAPLPSPPMSGSPPPEDLPAPPPQIAGRRRKRSTTPPAVTTAVAVESQTATEQASSGRRATQQREAPELATATQTAPTYPRSYPSAQSFSYGPGGPSILSSATTATTTLGPQLGSGDVSPKATRKTKAHVASACVNCKKKHLRCDNVRPCRRCVQSGKEASCVDVEHKKRGRPPLKPEENQPRRPFESAMSPLQGQLTSFGRLPTTQSPGYSTQQPTRDLRPLPSGSRGDTGRPVFPRPGPLYQTIYAQPTVSPSTETAIGTMSRPAQGGLTGYSQAQPPYSMTQSVSMPAPGPENFPQYAETYSYHSPQQTAPYSLFPRTSSQMPPSMQPTSRAGYAQMQSMPSDLRLPPIQPAPPGVGIDPAMAQQQRQTQHQQQSRAEQPGSSGTTRQPDPKRPKISDILRND